MKFLQGYVPVLWHAYEKRGLLNKDTGIRFCQSIDIDESLKFNNLASKGGKLYELVRELKCPLYIDRLQGGCFFEGYGYDMSLIDEYRNLLGDNFYGFQMHEWMSNFVSDTDRITDCKCPEPWTEEGICRSISKYHHYDHIYTEAMSPAEYARAGHITDIDGYLETMKRLFEKRQEYTDNMLLPCDSAFLGFSLEFQLGAKRVMPEIGHQTDYSSIQLAYARGSAKAYGKSFGSYYEPWGGDPFSACNYHKDSLNEWNISQESFPFHTAGGNGGSSRSLQRRIMLYSYLSGAEFFSEEWGAYNTFRDTEDFELTPYGEIKRDFIRFTEKYPDTGKPLTPVAAVIPKEITFLDNIDLDADKWGSFTPSPYISSLLKNMRDGLKYLYRGSECFGNENGNMLNSILPDAFDIVNEDCFDGSKYEYAVNLTGKDDIEKKCRCTELRDISRLLDGILPCKVTGGLHHIINKNEKGKYYLTVFNNTGIIRSVEKGEIKMKEAEKTVFVQIKDGRQLTMLEGDSAISADGDGYYVTVPAGGFFFGSF